MADVESAQGAVVALNASAAFNAWSGFEVVSAGAGEAELQAAHGAPASASTPASCMRR